MLPIAQTFTFFEPQNGVDAVFLTGIDLYFQNVSQTYGVTLQIRDTTNGVPTVNVIPYASKTLQANQVSSSIDSSIATNFTFDTPVIIQTNQQYALVLIPVGGNPDYDIWTGELGGSDVLTGNPIYNNNQLGTLFTSTNDLNFTAVPLESMKYNLYTATFTASSGTGVYRNSNTDFFKVNTVLGSFIPGEKIYVSNSVPAIGYANLQSGYTNTFTSGMVIYQGTALANSTANATVYFGNTSVVKFSNLQGVFTTGTVTSANSPYYTSNVVALNQNTSTTSNASVTVPDASFSDFSVNNFIFLTTNAKANSQIVKIISSNTLTNVLTVSPNVSFTDTNALIGRVRGDASLFGYLSSQTRTTPITKISLDGVTSNTTLNFSNTSGQYLIAPHSGSLANSSGLYNPLYESVTSQFAQITPNLTSSNWSFRGTSNTAVIDSSYTSVSADIPSELIDEQRMIMSRSLELSNTSMNGNSSLQTSVIMNSSNNLISPYIDKIRHSVTTTHNMISNSYYLSGYSLSITNANNVFNIGDVVWQSNSTVNTSAIVTHSNTSSVYVVNVSSSNVLSMGMFVANGTSIITDVNTGAVANITATQIRNEAINTGFISTRYISKNVNLAAGQDSEDIITYLGAYRPSGSNLLVYAKIAQAQDSDTFNNKDWSILPETSSPALQSSIVNTNDLVDLTYGFPTSNLIYSGGCTSNLTSNILNFSAANTTAPVVCGQFVYMADQSFNIANANITVAGSGYNNGDVVQLTGTSGYLNSNATFTVSTNATGNVVSLTVSTGGSYLSNTVLTAQTTSNNTGTGTGLTITTGTFNQSSKFNVRQVVSVPNTSAAILSSNTSILSGNVAFGVIPGLISQAGAFKYANNNGIVRYVTNNDAVYDTYLNFAIKIVLISNNSYIVPRIDDMRCLALQV